MKVVVLGAGVTGLCAAWMLRKRLGQDAVTVLEASEGAGGYARTENIDGFFCDIGPNGFLDRDPRILSWVDELGLTKELVRANSASAHRFILKDGRLIEMKPPPAFFRSPLVSLAGRLRLLREPFIRAKRDTAPESIWDFATRRIGREAAELLVQPIVTGVFGGDAKKLSLEHCFPNIAAMEREHGSLFRALKAGSKGDGMGPRGVLTTFNGGMERLCDRAGELMADNINYGVRVTSIQSRDGHYVIVTSSGEESADAVVCALPAYASASVLRGFDVKLSHAVARIDHAPIAVVCVGYPREAVAHDLKGFGFLVPRTEGKRMLGCIWTSTLFPHSAPEGYVFLRCMFGGATDAADVTLSDDDLLALVAREVHPLLGISQAPAMTRIYRHPHGIPQYGLDHGDVLAELDAAEARHPGFAIAGNGYRGVSLIDCVASAERAVERVGGAGRHR